MTDSPQFASWCRYLLISCGCLAVASAACAQAVTAQVTSGVNGASGSAAVSSQSMQQSRSIGGERALGAAAGTARRNNAGSGSGYRAMFSGDAGATSGVRPLSTFLSGNRTSSGDVGVPGVSAPHAPEGASESGSIHLALHPQATGAGIPEGEFPDSTRKFVLASPPFQSMPSDLLFHAGGLYWSPDFESATHLNPSYAVKSLQGAASNPLASWRRRAKKKDSDEEILNMRMKGDSGLEVQFPKDPLLGAGGKLDQSDPLK